jgi:hypothetical protein
MRPIHCSNGGERFIIQGLYGYIDAVTLINSRAVFSVNIECQFSLYSIC